MWTLRLIGALVFGALLVSGPAWAQVTPPTAPAVAASECAMTLPTTNQDGSALTDLAGAVCECTGESGTTVQGSAATSETGARFAVPMDFATLVGAASCRAWVYNAAGTASPASNESNTVVCGGGQCFGPLTPGAPAALSVQ